MERSDVFKMLKATGLPVAYRQWAPANPPKLPYILFFAIETRDMIADNENYHEVTRWCAELYSGTKDDEAENAIKRSLKSRKIPYSENEIGTNTDGLFEAVFYFTTY